MSRSEVHATCSPDTGKKIHLQDLTKSRLYIHSLPGRLRIEVPALRRDPQLASRIRRAIGGTAGVRRIEVSNSTRRVLIEYDPAVVSEEVLTGRLRLMGCFDDEGPAPGPLSSPTSWAVRKAPPPPRLRRHLARLLFHAFAETLAKSVIEVVLSLLF